MNNIFGRLAGNNGPSKDANGARLEKQRDKNAGWNILHQSQRLDSVNIDWFDASGTQPLASTSRAPFELEAISSEECVVCRESEVVLACITDRCIHPADTCTDCITQTIKVAVTSENRTDTIQCPSEACKEVMEYGDVKMWADDRTFERYNELLLTRVLQKEEGYVTCLNPACGAGQVHGGENIFPIVICYKCNAKSCYRHRTEWHEGYTCKEWDNREQRWKQEDILSREWVADQTKRCPGPGCNRPIRKEEGCDHMTCRRPGGCGFEFCWNCLAPYAPIRNDGNHRHKPTCTYYSAYRQAPPVAQPPPVLNAPANPPEQDAANRRRWGFWRRQAAVI